MEKPPCGETPMWSSPHVEQPPCGSVPMWSSPHVEQPPCGEAPMWRNPHVEQPPCGEAPMWSSPHVEQPPCGAAYSCSAECVLVICARVLTCWCASTVHVHVYVAMLPLHTVRTCTQVAQPSRCRKGQCRVCFWARIQVLLKMS